MARKIRIKLDDLLTSKGWTQRDLKHRIDQMRGDNKFRVATISEIYNNQRTSMNRKHLETIIEALEIDDISEFIEIVHE